MTSQPNQVTARRTDRCLLLGEATATVTVPTGWLAVVAPAGLPSSQLVAAVRAAIAPPPPPADDPGLAPAPPAGEALKGVVLLGAAGDAASALATVLDLPVVAPGDGPVAASAGGTLFTASGWWRHTADGGRAVAGLRWPAPAWQALIPESTAWPLTARAVPAGWLLSTVPDAAEPDEDTVRLPDAVSVARLADSVAVDPGRPRLLFDSTVNGPALAAALRTLPPAVRATVDVAAIAPGQGAGRAPAFAAAAALGEPVTLLNGLPLHTPSGDIVAYALDAAFHPTWAEPAWLLRCHPGGVEEVAASSAPQPGLLAIDESTYVLDLGWIVRVAGDGLHAMPSGPLPPPVGRAGVATAVEPPPSAGNAVPPPVVLSPRRLIADPASPAPAVLSPRVLLTEPEAVQSTYTDADVVPVEGGRYRVVVGTAGLDVNDLLWPPLSTLFTAALTDVPAAVDLEVAGTATEWGLAAARELAERHPGVTGTGAAAKPYARAEVLPLVHAAPAAESPVAGAGVRRGRRRLVLAGAAAVATVALGAGVVAVWPDGSAPLDSGSATGEQRTAPGLAPGAAGSSEPDPSVSGSPTASARASAPSSASAAEPGTSAASAGPSADPSSQAPPGLTDGLVNLAAGKSTRDSGHAGVYGSGNVTDLDPMSYWESHNAFPQWVQVDLGAPAQLRRAVLQLPPLGPWPARTQKIEVRVSNDDKTFSTLVAAAPYSFDPASGQRATIALPGSQWRYVRLVFTANSVQPAGQLSSLELYRA
ncbi:discoidin domain-containing protein [Dactylosporangium sp. CA-233914]|uniref:discoidin domain-containing protein n=1 Tax=Dactylosporangium sp. CA-233914 TaxID=3239934 RepID=UPI003D8E8D6E